MFTPLIASNDPRLRELRALVREIGADRKRVAQIEARETRNLARAEALAVELSAHTDDAPGGGRVFGQTGREDFAVQQVQAEIGAHIRVTGRTVARRMTDASRLIAEYPQVMRAFGRGEISREHATAIGDAGIIINNPGSRRVFEGEMVKFARTTSVNRVRGVVKQVAEKYADRDTETRLAEAHAGRSITIRPLDERLCLITAVVPSVQGVAVYDRLSQMARLVKRANNRARATYPGLGVDDGAPGGTFDVEAGSVPEGFTPAEWEALARVASDERTVMQIRTDLFLDIGITGYPSVLTCTDSTDSRESRVKGVSDDSGVSADSSNRQNGCRNLYCFHTSTANDAAKGAKHAAATASDVLQTGEHAITSEVGSDVPGYAITNAMLRNITAHVQVVIPMFSLLTAEQAAKIRNTQGINKMEQFSGCAGAPDLAGYGPIPPDIARLLLGTTPSWDRLLTNPVTGVVVTADQYSPTASVRRSLVARDMHCRFPGCRIPAKRCEVDHTFDWDHGGKTVPENLAHLCVKHHNLKHHSDWTVEQHAGGVMKWTSPLGRAFTDTPVSTVMFQPATKPGKPTGPTEPTGPSNDTPPPF